MYDKVLVLLDGSRPGKDLLLHVAAVIFGRESLVYLLSVAPTMGWRLRPMLGQGDEEAEQQRIRQERVAHLQSAAEQLQPVAGDVEIHVRFGRPTDETLAFAEGIDADLIATSAYYQPGFTRWIFGSVTNGLLRRAECPLLLVPPALRYASSSQPDYAHILVPLDGSKAAEQILPYVKALVRPHRTQISLISVLMTSLSDRTVALMRSYPPGLQLATAAHRHAELQLREYLRSVAARLREQGAIVRIAVREGAPSGEILRYAAEIEADLIGMTTHGLSGPSRWVYGNVAGQVLQGAFGPVLLARPAFERGGSVK